jgi:hypothetical protein
MHALNDRDFVERTIALLADAGIDAWLFGGWAEQLRGLAAPREHHDIDLLCPAPDFTAVDSFLASEQVSEILLKRLPHKRAFELDGVLVELVLVQRDDVGHYTSFWGSIRYDWPNDVFDGPAVADGESPGLQVASSTALIDFRKTYAERPAPSSQSR